jgi:hypothetical protein
MYTEEDMGISKFGAYKLSREAADELREALTHSKGKPVELRVWLDKNGEARFIITTE